MKQISRRQFCSAAAAFGTTALTLPSSLNAQPDSLQILATIEPDKMLAKVPIDFMGLSYESGQLAYPDFFSPRNTALIERFRTLSPVGVLRLGGNLSEYTVWSAKEPATVAEADGLVGPDAGHREPRKFVITPLSIRNLKGFLDAINWSCIYGLNLAGGSLEQALAEGAYVARTLRTRLVCVQFGNEPDYFKHRDQGDSFWTYDEYLDRWKTFRAAFHEKLPEVAVAGPDTASRQEWVKQFVKDVPEEIVLVTNHYYPEGPPKDPRMNIDLLLHPGKRFESSCRDVQDLAKAAGLPFRITECNSCYGAGKPGVSDTFASALWVGDFCLQIASIGCVGVNIHGGGNGYYSPIVGSIASGLAVRPEFYGLMLAQHFAGRTLRQVTIDAQGANVTAYAAVEDAGTGLVSIFNKDARNATVTLVTAVPSFKRATVERLEAPSIDSKDGLTLKVAIVGSDRKSDPRIREQQNILNGRLHVIVPAYSAAMIQLSRS